MADADTQISTFISADTKDMLERYARAHGVKKGFVIEQALRHHLEAMATLPLDIIVSPRIVVSAASGRQLVDRLTSPKPTAALKKLMKKDAP